MRMGMGSGMRKMDKVCHCICYLASCASSSYHSVTRDRQDDFMRERERLLANHSICSSERNADLKLPGFVRYGGFEVRETDAHLNDLNEEERWTNSESETRHKTAKTPKSYKSMQRTKIKPSTRVKSSF